MTRRDDGSYQPADLKKQLHFIDVLNRPEMPTFDVVEWETPIDSSDMTPDGWARIVRQVEEHYYAYDGFVVLHGAWSGLFVFLAVFFIAYHAGGGCIGYVDALQARTRWRTQLVLCRLCSRISASR